MPTGKYFSKEQWDEIYAARARLQAFKLKIQPYPIDDNIQTITAKPIFKPRPIDYEIDQLKAGFIHLQNKLNEHIDKAKNGKGKDIL